MRPSQFFDMQAIDVIQWSEPEAGTLAGRYPMLDMEVQTGAKLVVRECEMAVLVDQGRMADVFGPGRYMLNSANLPLLSGLKNWDKGFASPFKTDIYFFATGDGSGQKWGTTAPIVLGEAGSGAVRMRGYGSYAYRIADVRTFFTQVSGMRESYCLYDLDDRLRKTIVARMADVFSGNADPTTDTAVQSETMADEVGRAFAALGLELTRFSMDALSLEEEGKSSVDERMGMSLAGSWKIEAADSCACCGARMRADHDALKCDYCHAVVAADADDDEPGMLAESAGHACPVCEIPLLQAIVGGASLSYCTRCDGMLVAMEEFDALVAAARALPGGAGLLEATEMRDPFDCPECGCAMGVSFYGGDVAVDSCEGCGLNWLDHRELARIAHAPVSDANTSGAYFNPAPAASQAGLNMNV